MIAPLLTVLSREYCHLCEDMIAALRKARDCSGLAAAPFDLQVIDIDAHPALEEKYGELVPVLLAGEREICHYHLDPTALSAYLAEIQ